MNRKKLALKGILFDLDGTIVDSRPAYLNAAEAAFEFLGQKPLIPSKALEIPKRLEQHIPLGDLVGTDVNSFLRVYLRTYYEITNEKTKPLPEVIPVLHTLSSKAKLALITMRFVPVDFVLRELKNFGLADCFSHVLTACENCKPKPSPDGLIKAMRALNVAPHDCAIVGDSVADVRAGKAAGVSTVAVLSGLYTRDELAGETPNLILKDASKLTSYFDFGD